jgi:hypothetical protein
MDIEFLLVANVYQFTVVNISKILKTSTRFNFFADLQNLSWQFWFVVMIAKCLLMPSANIVLIKFIVFDGFEKQIANSEIDLPIVNTSTNISKKFGHGNFRLYYQQTKIIHFTEFLRNITFSKLYQGCNK